MITYTGNIFYVQNNPPKILDSPKNNFFGHTGVWTQGLEVTRETLNQ
jgi:hypothetical protein